MRPPIVVESNPITDDSHRMRLTFEAMPVDALFLERPDDTLDQSVLLGAMRRDELLFRNHPVKLSITHKSLTLRDYPEN
jgi:hypothetical protein